MRSVSPNLFCLKSFTGQQYLERKGIMILAATLPDYVFGMSTWADKKHPLMILDFNPEKSPVEKFRFTAVHELAHLLFLFPPYYI